MYDYDYEAVLSAFCIIQVCDYLSPFTPSASVHVFSSVHQQHFEIDVHFAHAVRDIFYVGGV